MNAATPLPPHSDVVERELLGGLMIDSSAFERVLELVDAGDFHRPDHRLVFSAVVDLHARHEPFDAVLVAEHLRESGRLEAAGGVDFVKAIVHESVGATNVEAYARKVHELAQERRQVAAFARADKLAREGKIEAAHAAIHVGNARLGTDHKLKLVTLDEFVVRPNVRWLIRDILQPQTIAVTFGPPKGGKTFSMTDLLMHAAHGMDWHGHAMSRPLRVAFLAGEGVNGLRVRLHAWLAHHDTAERCGDFRLLPETLSLPDRIEDVVNVLKPYRPEIVHVDTVNSYYGPGDENSTQDMSRFVASLRTIRDEVQCAVAVNHHTGLADTGRERGSNVLRAAADAIIQVAKDENDTGLVGFQVVTGCDVEPWDEALSLRLRKVDTDWLDDDGQPITTCVVEGASTPVTLAGRGQKFTDAQRLTIKVVEQLAKARANGSGKVLLALNDIANEVEHRGGNRTSAYWHFEQLAKRMRWKEMAPNSLEVEVR